MTALIATLMLRAGLGIEVSGCAADAATLGRMVLLEWAAPPAGAHVTVACTDATSQLAIEAPGFTPLVEQLEVPKLEGSARVRVLALIIAERGRGLTLAPKDALPPPPGPGTDTPEPKRPPLIAAGAPSTSAEVEPEPPAAPLRGALLGTTAPHRPWRVALSAATQRPISYGPLRFGPELRVDLGPIGITASSTVGSATVDTGTLTAFAITVEPELHLACAGGQRWQLCGSARGVLGYGAITATSALSGIVAKTQQGPALGAAAAASASFAITDWLAVDLDARVGWQWAVYASSLGTPVASVGGAFAAASLGVAAAWGRP